MSDYTQRETKTEEQSGEAQVYSGRWARDQVILLFEELSRGTAIKQVQLRSRFPDQMANGVASLEDARAAFVSDHATAIQIRYEYQDALWCDTILPEQGSAQVIRTQLPMEY
ncbi:MAG: hypothetical protein KatS3mg111_3600 [Pirellulaceae bacterium]|nr:MAG: hypothetical protein KatS3mg111_3600 [Pirellulaceae bacterium]